MDKLKMLEECKKAGLEVSEYIHGTEEMAYRLVINLCNNYEFSKARGVLKKSPIYYYLVLKEAFIYVDNKYRSYWEMYCKEFVRDVIEPIFSFDEKFLISAVRNGTQEAAQKWLAFIKKIPEIKFEEISSYYGLIDTIQWFLVEYYKTNPCAANFSKYITTLSFLEHVKVDKPIQCKKSGYDIAEIMYDNEKLKICKKNHQDWLMESFKAVTLFNILIVLATEDKEKVNDFILNNMMNVLDNQTNIEKSYLDNIPQEISSILTEQKEKKFIDIDIQKKLIDFLIKHNQAKLLCVDYCEELEDYIFENYVSIFEDYNNCLIEDIVLRNVNKIDKITDEAEIQINLNLFEKVLNYELWQCKSEIDRCTYDKNKYNKVLEMITNVGNEIPQTREFIQTLNPEQTVNSIYLIYGYFKNTKQKNKKIVDSFNAIVKDGFLSMIEKIKNKNIIEKTYKKLKNKSLEIFYEEEINEIKELIDIQYKKYLEEFKNSKKYSFEKYYEKVETQLNKETNFNRFIKNKNLSEVFNKILLTYNTKQIKELLASNEYYLSQLQEGVDGCELTPLMTCLIKAIEQFMCALIKYAYNKGWCASDVINDKFEHKLSDINWEKTKITCSPLKTFIEDNILNNENNFINAKFKSEIVESLENFIDKVRNGHFHKHNIFGFNSVKQYVTESYNTISGLITLIVYLEEKI